MTVTIPNGVKSIGDFAFKTCGIYNQNATSVSISNSVESIGINPFNDANITSINVANDNVKYASEDGVLFNKDKSTLIAFPGAKSGIYNIPNSVTSIGNYAFSSTNPPFLTSITIPNTVITIGKGAFSLCMGLTDVTVEWTTPLSVQNNIFSNISSATLHVPYGTKALYEADPVWGTFGTIVEQAPTSVVNISNSSFHAYITNNVLKVESPQAEKITVYSAKGVLLYTALKTAGGIDIPVSSLRGSVYIIKGSVSGTIKVVR